MTDKYSYPWTEIHRVFLETMKIRVAHRISKQTLKNISSLNSTEIDGYLEPLTNDLFITMDRYIYGRKASVSVSYPATWWDHVKRDLLPSWVTKHLEPIRLKTENVVAREVFPEIAYRKGEAYIEIEDRRSDDD